MEVNNYKVEGKIKFQEEILPYTVQAVSDRYLICTRPFDKVVDYDVIEHGLKMCTYCNEEEALEDLENLFMYTIVDLGENIRGADNYNSFSDYSTKEECKEVLKALYTEEVNISYKNRIKLNIV